MKRTSELAASIFARWSRPGGGSTRGAALASEDELAFAQHPSIRYGVEMQLVLISGLSGSGKSIALNALEDSGYYCIDNLPGQLLQQSAELLRRAGHDHVAMSIDARTGDSLELVPEYVAALKGQGVDLRLLFLDAKNDTLIRRFSETRRRHPLATGTRTLEEALTREREVLAPVGEIGYRLDTTDLLPNMLRKLTSLLSSVVFR